ncbi:hypothetical protein ASD24_16440 [Paenibacillus sp. Root52]|nr:hypothetical protein ASD24_16440 [Paenibacillus sp. Root52]
MLQCSLLLRKFVGSRALWSHLCLVIDDGWGMDEKTLEILKTLTLHLTWHNSNVSRTHYNNNGNVHELLLRFSLYLNTPACHSINIILVF